MGELSIIVAYMTFFDEVQEMFLLFSLTSQPESLFGKVQKTDCLDLHLVTVSLQASSPGRAEKDGELATSSLKFEFHLQFPCGSPSTELSDSRQSARKPKRVRM